MWMKQSPNRNQRKKSLKVTQGFKIFALIAVAFWLLYQLKQSHDNNKSYEESSAKIFEKLKVEVGHETNKLGRKGFQPWINKPYQLIDGTEESEPERVMEQSSGGGDDVVGHDGDRVEEEEPEEVEDLTDGEDKEEEEENEEMEQDMSLLSEDQGHNEDEKDTQAVSNN